MILTSDEDANAEDTPRLLRGLQQTTNWFSFSWFQGAPRAALAPIISRCHTVRFFFQRTRNFLVTQHRNCSSLGTPPIDENIGCWWLDDGVSWLCHVVADLTCTTWCSFILLTSCILALPTYRLLGWSSYPVEAGAWSKAKPWIHIDRRVVRQVAYDGVWPLPRPLNDQCWNAGCLTLGIAGSQGTVYQANVHRWNFSMLGWEEKSCQA